MFLQGRVSEMNSSKGYQSKWKYIHLFHQPPSLPKDSPPMSALQSPSAVKDILDNMIDQEVQESSVSGQNDCYDSGREDDDSSFTSDRLDQILMEIKAKTCLNLSWLNQEKESSYTTSSLAETSVDYSTSHEFKRADHTGVCLNLAHQQNIHLTHWQLV